MKFIHSLWFAFAGVSGAVSGSPVAPGNQGDIFQPTKVKYTSVQLGDTLATPRGDPLRIVLKSAASVRTLPVNEPVEQIQDVRRLNDTLIVAGWMNPSRATDVSFYSLSSLRRLTNFWAYKTSISPDGKRIAYIQFYPSHGARNVQDIVRIYDIVGISDAALAQQAPAPDEGMVAPGDAIFPNGPDAHDNVDIDPGKAVRVLSDLTWMEDGTLSFIYRRSGAIWLMSVDASAKTSARLLGDECSSGGKQKECVTFHGLAKVNRAADGRTSIWDDSRLLKTLD